MTKDKAVDILYTAYSQRKGYRWLLEQSENSKILSENESIFRKYLVDGCGLDELSDKLSGKRKASEIYFDGYGNY